MKNIRITYKKLVDLVNELFVKYKIVDFEVIKVERTYYSRDAYEAGASKLIITFKNKLIPSDSLLHLGYFNCFFSISELQFFLNNGYELFLSDKGRSRMLSSFELDIKKLE